MTAAERRDPVTADALKRERVPWFRSIRFRLVMVAVVIELGMLAVLLANSYRLVSEALESQTRARLEALEPLFNAALAGYVFQRDHSEIQAILQNLVESRFAEISYIVVLDSRDRLIASVGAVDLSRFPGSSAEDRSVADALTDLVYDTSVPLTLSGNTLGRVYFGLTLSGMATLRDSVLQQSLVIAVIAVGLSLLLLASAGYLITRHIGTLVRVARDVARGDFSVRIPVSGNDEITLLTADFNRMAEAVETRIKEIRYSELRFRAIFNRVSEAIFIHDSGTGALLDVNDRACQLFGVSRELLLASGIVDFSANTPPYTEVEAMARMQAAAAGEPQVFDWLARRPDGSLFWVEVALSMAHIGDEHRLLAVVHDISDRKRHEHELEFMAHHDPLTQLPNRVLLADRLLRAIAHARRTRTMLAVGYLDLDGFKPVNDNLGHEVGDRLLTQVARRLSESMREEDTVARLGGDEFVLLISDIATAEESRQFVQRLLQALAQPYRIDQHSITVTASIGLTLYPADDTDPDTLLRHADQAMYVAKQSGRNRCHTFDAEHDRISRARLEAQERIQAALAAREFVLYYQPKCNMRTGAVIGMEALIRWNHPQKGVLAPAHFLPVIDGTEFVVPLGEWVIERALQQIATWAAAGLTLPVSINIFPRHLQIPDFADRLRAILSRHPGVPPAMLEIELVETAALEDIAQVSSVVDECHALGVRFSLDDFGTGYSSLTYFKRLKVDVLKIDQSFVRDMLDDPEDRAIVEGIVALTRSFRRDVIAEGVETEAIGRALLAIGCELGQGYGIARPMPADAVAEWVGRSTGAARWLPA